MARTKLREWKSKNQSGNQCNLLEACILLQQKVWPWKVALQAKTKWANEVGENVFRGNGDGKWGVLAVG